MDIYGNIKKLCDKNGISTYKLCKDLGLSTALMSQWKSGRQEPSNKKLELIAGYFGVPVENLIVGGDWRPPRESPEDRELMRMMEEVRNNPGMRVLFSKTRGASKEDIEKVIKLIEIMKGEDGSGLF